MVDQGFWGIGHSIAVVQPAVTELAILCCSTSISRVKAAHCTETVCRHSQIVGSEKACLIEVGVVVAVKVSNE